MKPGRATRTKQAGIQPKIEPALNEEVGGITGLGSHEIRADTIMETPTDQDVNPDVGDLESLLGDLNLEQ